MSRSILFAIPFTVLLVAQLAVKSCDAHGSLLQPCPRGSLRGNPIFPKDCPPLFPNAPIDYKLHFPAGDKLNVPGVGKSYQKRTGKVFMEFDPMNPKFRWRAGVCGDMLSGGNSKDHLKGGKYYFNGQIVKTYKENDYISFKVAIAAHHKGFFRFHVCNVKNCPNNDITTSCFNRQNCRELERAPLAKCQSRYSTDCAPIQSEYKGRWYVPCENRKQGRKYSIYGLNNEILYRLPKGFTCDHCVLHFFWTSANNCKPKGVLDYFKGKKGPLSWTSCLKRNSDRNSYTSKTQECGGRNEFPEEYYQCADISIKKK